MVSRKKESRDQTAKTRAHIGRDGRKTLEDALKESELRYRALIESSPDAITQTDLSGRILMCNSRTAFLHGYDGPEDLIGKSAFGLFPPDELERAGLNLQKTLTGKVVNNIEYRFLKKDGAQFHGELSATAILDAAGKPTSFMAITRDITERKKAEISLKESEERFIRLAQAGFEGISIHDKGLIQDANQAMADLFGYEHSELIGMNVLNLAMPEARDTVRDNFLTGNDKPYEAMGRKKDGSAFMGELRGSRITYRGHEARVVAIRDISERKRMEAAVAAEKERLAVTLRSIGDAVIATDVQGNIALMNRVAEDLTGWPLSEATGKPLSEVFNVINELTRDQIENPVDRVLLSGEIIELANHTLLVSRDGAQRVIADSGAPIKDNENKIIGVVLVFRDITEKQKLLDTIQRTAKLDSLGILAGGIAHDFNNLLTGIYGYMDLARFESKDARITEYLEAMLDTMKRAKALTLQLLTFSKGGSPIRKITPLLPVIRETAQFALSGSSSSCRFSLAENLLACNIDKDQIAQVIDNIVINAQQAMPEGGAIDITAINISFKEKEHPPLANGDYVKVSIKDSGIGIPKEIISRIFDPFYTTKSKGHGLGLATCHSIISRHGGCIDVESKPGKGSTFHFYLPASSETVAPPEAKVNNHKGGGTIIIMDDEEVVRDTLRHMLELLGYAVIVKNDGGEVLDFFVNEKPDRIFAAMIFDLTVPGGKGGLEAIKEIRKLNKEIPVFVASGYADNAVMKNPADHGFTASISKPFTISDLSELLNNYLKPRG